MAQADKVFNIPNVLSFYRLLSFPFVLWLVYVGNQHLFAVFICINLITDILDGWIARSFNMQTELGARLDSLADIGTYILAFLGVYAFNRNDLGSDIWIMWLAAVLFVAGYIVSYIKFRQYQSLHLYSTKIGGYVQGAFFFILFAFSYYQPLYYVAMAIGCISFTEEIIILFVLKKLRSDVKGLMWVMRA